LTTDKLKIMRKLSLFLGAILLLGTQIINAQDIFKQHGFDKKPLTLSNGRYNEFFNNDEIVQIGTVFFNTKTNKVIAFIDEDTSKAAYLAELSSRWLTPDPLAAKYPEVSPYVYCANNPIKFVDPDGQDFAIYIDKDKDGNTTIRITATYYVQKGDADSKKSADQATKFWNDQSGQFAVKSGDKNNPSSTTINFDLKVVEVDNPNAEMRKDKAGTDDAITKDGSSNAYSVVDQLSTPGDTKGANKIRVREKEKDDYQTGAHEIGHTLLMNHEGTNSNSVMCDGNTGASSVNRYNVGDVITGASKNLTPGRISIHGDLPKGKVKNK
jgi:hypothetical protein